MTINKRNLGKQGLVVSAIGLGCMGMSQSYGPADETESIKVLRRAVEIGCNFFDTAEGYGPYKNEDLLGRAFEGHRNEVIIATKVGFKFEDGKQMGATRDGSAENIRRAVEGCLRRLRTDYIDLLYQHRVDPNVPIEEMAGVVSNLVKEGKVRFWGLSEAGVNNIRKAHTVHPLSALQSEYSLWERGLENDVIPAICELGIGLVSFCPLGRGFLAGNVSRAEEYSESDTRHHDPRYQGTNFDANRTTAQVVFDIANAIDATPAQIALAWILSKGENFVPIPGTKRIRYIEENVAAASITLTHEQVNLLDTTMASPNISGQRYPDWIMETIDR
jgi:aryl-alcohol dehydrogenase-like predicted oxidoreductase